MNLCKDLPGQLDRVIRDALRILFPPEVRGPIVEWHRGNFSGHPPPRYDSDPEPGADPAREDAAGDTD